MTAIALMQAELKERGWSLAGMLEVPKPDSSHVNFHCTMSCFAELYQLLRDDVNLGGITGRSAGSPAIRQTLFAFPRCANQPFNTSDNFHG